MSSSAWVSRQILMGMGIMVRKLLAEGIDRDRVRRIGSFHIHATDPVVRSDYSMTLLF